MEEVNPDVDGYPTFPKGPQEARITAIEQWNLHTHLGNRLRAWLWRRRRDYIEDRISMY